MKENQTLSKLNPKDFKGVIDGKDVELIVLTNSANNEVCITNYGAFVVSIVITDKNGVAQDVVLGHSTLEEYINTPEKYLGSVVGRYANRIANGKFKLNEKEYNLAINNGPNNLHGGIEGFNRKVWKIIERGANFVTMFYVSPDGEEGFPGNLAVTLRMIWSENNELCFEYEASTDQPTVVNLTNHAFFNLSGAGEETILDHQLQMNCKFYTPTDETSIPTGEILRTENTPMDFSQFRAIGERIDEEFTPLIYGKGYDHNYIIDKSQPNQLVSAASAFSPKTGIQLEVITSEPGVQLYTGNWLNGFSGKGNKIYPERSAFCLEAQRFPNTPNIAHFPSCMLEPGELYNQTTIYAFSVIK
ncbi:MAG: aldose epimerase family protein [Bacteroidales bacterium]